MQTKVVNVTDNPEQGVRLESLIECLNLTQTSLAQTLGISQSYVSQMIGGTRNISRRVLHFITNNYPEVNVRWLMTGDGSMFLEKKEEVAPLESGVLVGVMEPNTPVYEKRANGGGGVLESALARLSVLEGKVAELEDENESLRARLGDAEVLLLSMNSRLSELGEGGEGESEK